jgi:uncharacterized protein YjdB
MDPAILIRRVVMLLALAACIHRPEGPGYFGELRLEPEYRAGQEPVALGVSVDTAIVLATRPGSTIPVVNQRVPYHGDPLAWIVDLVADEEVLAVTVELHGGGISLYRGDTTLVARHGDLSRRLDQVAVHYVGPFPIASVTVAPDTAVLAAPGATAPFMAEAWGPTGQPVPGAVFTWWSSDTTVATVDPATGVATATGHGRATITASAEGRTGSAAVLVNLEASVASVTVIPDTAFLLALGATQQFVAEARDHGGVLLPGVAFAWAVGDQAVATIDSASGLATATGHGSTAIIASVGGVTGSGTLIVDLTGRAASVTVTPALDTLRALGATRQFTAVVRDPDGVALPGVPVTWQVSDPSVAIVGASSGLAVATGTGQTMIIATSGWASGTATLVVTPGAGAVRVTIAPKVAVLHATGDRLQFTAVARDANGGIVPGVLFSWESADTVVATIDPTTGVATARRHGNTLIIVTAGVMADTASLKVDYLPFLGRIEVTPPTATLTAVGAVQLFTAQAFHLDGRLLPGVPFAWSSDAPAVAAVGGATGLATAVGQGSATITAAAGTARGTAAITVSLAPTVVTITVTPSQVTLIGPGSSQQFTAVARDQHGAVVPGVQFTWTAADPGIVAINPVTGLATPAGEGTTTITATAAGIIGTATVRVAELFPET